MSIHSQWLLEPRFCIRICSSPSIESSAIFILSEDDLEDTSNTMLNVAKAQFGSLKAKSLYPHNEKFGSFFCIAPKDEPKSLGFDPPGKAHIASFLGAYLVQILANIPIAINQKACFSISLTKSLQEKILGEESEFILGIFQRSITCHVQKPKTILKSTDRMIELSSELFTEQDLKRAEALSAGLNLTRSLINMPPNILNPDSYEQFIYSLTKDISDKLNLSNVLEISTYDYDCLLKDNSSLITAVGKGSHLKPRLIKLTYNPKTTFKDQSLAFVSLVGKGVTFDSGGYDLKTATSMRNMKKDMGGSAAVLGSFFAAVYLALPVRLSCYLVLAENLLSSEAMKPGDVYVARNGLMVEIDNTDAEGRLLLADALCYACEEKPDWLLNLATLTGAARVSLGPMIDSLFGNKRESCDLLYKIGIETGDWVWNIPLPADYESYLDSGIADCVNSSTSSFAGSITAALFLKKFVSVTNWNHIDTFMWSDKANGLWNESSAPSGKCVRLVTRSIESFISK